MPQIIYAPREVADLVRFKYFLKTKNSDAAKRAVNSIKLAIQKSAVQPERFRPAQDQMCYRKISVDFGSCGYVARFRYEQGSNIIIVRIKHQLEDDFQVVG